MMIEEALALSLAVRVARPAKEWRASVRLERRGELLVLVHVDRQHGPEELGAHGRVGRILGPDHGRGEDDHRTLGTLTNLPTQLAEQFKARPEELPERINGVVERLRQAERELEKEWAQATPQRTRAHH